MARLSRRSVLKNIAKVSALGAMAPWVSTLGCTGDYQGPIKLNVVLHGLFVLNVLDNYVELLTPLIDEHIHKAGCWDYRTICDIPRGTDSELRGVMANKSAFPNPPDPEIPYLVSYAQDKYKFSIHHEKSHHRIVLPFPSAFRLRRLAPLPGREPAQLSPIVTSDPAPGCYQYGVPPIQKLSLCQVLTYDVTDYSQLRLTGMNWYPPASLPKYPSYHGDQATAPTINLHLWAEPHKRLNPEHADHAYQTLSELIELNMRLQVSTTTPVDDCDPADDALVPAECKRCVPGLPPEQEQGWSEWASGGGEGAYPTNCCTVITRKTSPIAAVKTAGYTRS